MKRTIACALLALSSFAFGCAAEPADEAAPPAANETTNDLNVDVNTDTTNPALLPKIVIQSDGCVRIGKWTCCRSGDYTICIGDAEIEKLK